MTWQWRGNDVECRLLLLPDAGNKEDTEKKNKKKKKKKLKLWRLSQTQSFLCCGSTCTARSSSMAMLTTSWIIAIRPSLFCDASPKLKMKLCFSLLTLSRSRYFLLHFPFSWNNTRFAKKEGYDKCYKSLVDIWRSFIVYWIIISILS